MKTYRYRGHSRSDPAKYRAEGELDAWKARDPLSIYGERLAADGTLAAGAQGLLREEVQAEVDAAAERATESPYLTLEEAGDYVYAG